MKFFAGLVFLGLSACNNYDLLDKLENPGNLEKFTDRLFVFVTSMTTQGNMQSLPASNCAATGKARADCACQNIAAQNGRRRSSSSRFVAWLSDTGSEMRCRIVGQESVGCAPTGTHVWYNTGYQAVFSGLENSTTGVLGAATTLSFSPQYTETGALITGETDNVWTGTDAGGIQAGNNCSGWTDIGDGTTPQGRLGTASSLGPPWTNSSDLACTNYKRIYCFALP